MDKNKPIVGILMGSESDLAVMEETKKVLDDFGVSSEVVITSAHRTPRETEQYARSAADRGLKVLIAGAGHAAHLAGVIAANTTIPVIGVPIDSSPLKGIDSLLSTVQMPGGIPVAAMAIGKSGAKNAALYAIAILATGNPKLGEKLASYRKKMAEKVIGENKKIRGR